jgi:hypothetical protein
MLLTKRFVLLHVPKTGGSFLTDLCLKHLPPEWEGHEHRFTHMGYQAIPPEFAGLPTVVFVRNPWDWYVSWYRYAVAHPPLDGDDSGLIWQALLGGGRYTFKQAVTSACRPQELAAGGSRPRWLQQMESRDVDYYSAMHTLISGSDVSEDQVTVQRFENLRQGFLDFLDVHDVAVPEALREACLSAPPMNASERAPDYREYYDDGLRELIRNKASALIGQYGYDF